MRFAACLVIAFLAAAPARAALTWTQKTLHLKADAKSTVMEGSYHFTNAGPAPLDIQQVESSCGCTTVELEKRHYEPGEGGEIVARFTIGTRVGTQTKTIAVKTRGEPEPDTLTLVVDIPEILRVRPAFVYWMQNEAPQPKVITIEADADTAVDKISVQSSNPGMSPELKEVVKGKRYELTVTPAKTDKVQFSMLTLDCHFGGKEPKTFRAYATVKPSEVDSE